MGTREPQDCPSGGRSRSPPSKATTNVQAEGIPNGRPKLQDQAPGQKHGKAKQSIAKIPAKLLPQSNQLVAERFQAESRGPIEEHSQTRVQGPQSSANPDPTFRGPGRCWPPVLSHTPCTPQTFCPKQMQKKKQKRQQNMESMLQSCKRQRAQASAQSNARSSADVLTAI